MAIFRVPINLAYPGTGGPGVNVWHVRTNSPASSNGEALEANAILGYIRTFYNTIGSWYPTGTVISLGTVTTVDTQREFAGTFASVAGSGTGSAPQLLALVNTWKTSVAARRGRGRTFIGPLCTAAMQNDGTPAAAFLSDVSAASTTLVNASTAYLNGAICIWGYSDAKLPGKQNLRDPNDPKVARDITGFKARDVFASLRSRRD